MDDVYTPLHIRIAAVLLAIAVLVWMGFQVANSVYDMQEVEEARGRRPPIGSHADGRVPSRR